MIQQSRIKEIVSNLVDGTGLFVVDIMVKPGNSILVHVDSEKGVSIDECAKISRGIEVNLSRDEEDFDLEVSSPGLLLPLKVIQQYHKNIGHNVEVLTKNGQKITGKILTVTPEFFIVETGLLVKTEGKKKPQRVLQPRQFTFEEVKSTKVAINFNNDK